MRTIMLIHGAWLTPAAWQNFKMRFEARGYHVLAPSWPHDERPLARLRSSPCPDLAKLTVRAIVDHYDALIRALPEPPILIGHSFGGLFVQQLLDRGLGAVGVAIDPAAPRGVAPSLNALRGALAVFTKWRSWARTLTLTPEQFAFAFVNTLPEPEQRRAYDRYAAPTPGRIYWQSALGLQTAVGFANPERAPLLLVAGQCDQTVSTSMVEAVHRKYGRSPARTDLRVFPARPHLLIASPGWEEVADSVLSWVEHNLGNEHPGDSLAEMAA